MRKDFKPESKSIAIRDSLLRIFEIFAQNIMVVDNSELAENPFFVMKQLEIFLNISNFFTEGRVFSNISL